MVCFMKPRRYFWHNLIDSLLLAVTTVSILIVFTTNVAILVIDPILSPDGNGTLIITCLILILPAVHVLDNYAGLLYDTKECIDLLL